MLMLCTLLLWSFLVAPAPTVDAALAELRTDLPVPGKLISEPAASAWDVSLPGELGESRLVQVPGVPGGEARRVRIDQPGTKTWDAVAHTPLTHDVAKGDVMLLAFYARAEEADNEAQSGVLPSNHIELSQDPWLSAAGSAALVSGDWRLVYASGVAPEDGSAGEAVVSVHLAAARQTLDLGPVFVLNLGPDVDVAALPKNVLDYPGRSPDAAWREEAAARIEEHRKADLRIEVRDADGEPVEGATVHVSMQKHAFNFGAFPGDQIVGQGDPDLDRLRASFLKNFNFATLPLYWQDWGWQDDASRRQYVDAMRWMVEHDVSWRGHPVLYPERSQVPTRIVKLEDDPEAFRSAVLEHVREVMTTIKPFEPVAVDLINEVRDGVYLGDTASGDVVAEAFRLAHEIAPDVQIFVNDYGLLNNGGANAGNIDRYHAWLDDMKAKDVPVGGIGFQGHFGAGLTHPARVVEVLDDFSRHGLPIHVTEFDIDTRDEQGQADYTRDFLTAVFSHPSVEAFVMWGWWEGDQWRPDGAMLREDWSAKPNYATWRELVFKTWWTEEKTTTAADGSTTVRGFLGDYTIKITHDGKVATTDLTLDADGVTVRARL